jgi:hypothetical protein
MKKFLGLLSVMLLLAAAGFGALAGGASAAPLGKDYVCHHTSSATNPVVIINISQNATPHHLALHGGTGDDFVIDESIPGQTSADCLGTAQTAALIGGVVYFDADFSGTLASGELHLANVTVTLTGTDYLNQPVSASMLSLADGTYSFAVLPGTYNISFGSLGIYVPSTSAEPLPAGAVASVGLISGIPVAGGENLVLNLPEVLAD